MRWYRSFLAMLFFVQLGCVKKEHPLPPSQEKGSLAFVKTLGGSKNEVANSVTATTDGGYAIAGYTQSNDQDITDKPDEGFDYWVLKYSANSTLEWQQTYGGSADDKAKDIIQTTDSGYAVLGYSKSADGDLTENAGAQDFWLLKLDASGNKIWQKSIGFSGADYGTAVTQTIDGGYVITGALDVTSSGGEGNFNRHAGGDYWALKLSTTGVLEWSRYFGGSYTDVPYGVVQTDSGELLIAGSSDSNDVDISANNGTYDFWLVKISSTGTLLWEKSFGGSQIDEARGIVATHDGHFLVVGDTRSEDGMVTLNNGAADLWVLKINTDGEVLWEKTIGGTNFDVARAVCQTQDNGFLVAGSSRSTTNSYTNKGQNDAYLVQIASDGNVVWEQNIGGAEIDYLYDVVALQDGSVVGVGESSSANVDIPENKGFTDLLLIKLH